MYLVVTSAAFKTFHYLEIPPTQVEGTLPPI